VADTTESEHILMASRTELRSLRRRSKAAALVLGISIAVAITTGVPAAQAAPIGTVAGSLTGTFSDIAVASDPTNGPLIAGVTTGNVLDVKEGSTGSPWNDEYSNVTQVAVASDPTNGPLIAAVLSNGTVIVKEGSLGARWNTEYVGTEGQFDGIGVVAVSVASDPVHGPLIGILLSNGAFLVKDGSLTASWNDELNCPTSASIAVASDAANGPLIGVVCQGNAAVKEGSLTSEWYQEDIAGDPGEARIYLASDANHGPLIGVVSPSGDLYVKEGSLSAAWNDEWNGYFGPTTYGVSLASDIANGPTIAVALGNGTDQVKSGSLTGGWVTEASDSVSSATQVAVASDQHNGPLIGVLTNAPKSASTDTYYVKEGSLGATWY
jgi:hypothetical protein